MLVFMPSNWHLKLPRYQVFAFKCIYTLRQFEINSTSKYKQIFNSRTCYQFCILRNLRIDIKDRLEEHPSVHLSVTSIRVALTK